MKRNAIYGVAAAISLAAGMCTPREIKAQEPQARFDLVVRNDFFAGFTGDSAALDRAMAITSKVLSQNPGHAEALVWHGAGLFFQAGQAFQSGNQQAGMQLWQKSMAEMDRAVELEPNNIGVRIPRGGPLLAGTRQMPADMARPLVERAVSDYRTVYDMQKSQLSTMPTHPKGELLIGLADGYDRLGEKEQSRAMLELIIREMPDSIYGRNAKTWIETGALPAAQRGCLGCHVGTK
jgi:hypothetical protein